MELFAVIDTETNWGDEVMSIGVAIADARNFSLIGTKYYIVEPEASKPGMYSSALRIRGVKISGVCSRKEALRDLCACLDALHITDIFAYNAAFDCKHMPELSGYTWYDIMRIAAYKQFNPSIDDSCECCSTGRMKHNYGVEAMTRRLSGNMYYREKHNALTDAVDELKIMQMLGRAPEDYIVLQAARK